MTRLRSVILLVLALLLAVLAGCAPEEAVPGGVQGVPLPGEVSPPLISGMGVIETAPPPSSEEAPPSSAEEDPASSQAASSSSSSSTPSSSSQPLVSSSSAPSSSLPPSSPSSSSPVPSSSSTPASSRSQTPSSEEWEEEPDQEDPPSQSSSSFRTSSSSSPSSSSEETPPSGGGTQTLKVSAGGRTVSGSAADIVAQIVANEMGGSFPEEAIKAQAVAAYTYVRFYNSTGTNPSVGLSTPNTRIKGLVDSVIGETVRYDGSICLAVYCAYNSGNTASSQNVWGRSYDYLQSVYSDYDVQYNNGGATKKIAASTLQGQLERALSVNLSGVDKEDWFEILSWHDDDYVKEVRIGGQTTITGRHLRENILGGTTLRSTAFEVSYDGGSDQFVFVTQGYGHGVGLSQRGAELMAKDGWGYREILEHYFPGAEVAAS